METEGNYKWIEFYEAFANSLLAYQKDRPTLIDKIQHAYDKIGMKLPTLERGGVKPVDIDPFTIYGLFNKGITDEKRKSIIRAFIIEFSVNAEVPHDFGGIPVLNNMSATFYGFEGDRQEHDIDNLWQMFSAAIDLAADDTGTNRGKFCQSYNQAVSQFCVKWNLTMGLYWMRPYAYLNLDSCNRAYMKNPENVPADVVGIVASLKTVPSAERYLELRDKCLAATQSDAYPYQTLPELSEKAWVASVENGKWENGDSRERKSNAAFLKWFKPLIQALRELGGSATPVDARKKIIVNEHLSEAEVSEIRGKNKVNKFENEVAFARSYLVSGGYIDNSIRGVWVLTESGKTVDMTDELAAEIFRNSVTSMRAGKSVLESALGDGDVDTLRCWLYAPGKNAVMWDDFYNRGIMGLGWDELGDLNVYASREEMRDKLRELYGSESSYKNSVQAVWQFAHDLKPGDVVFVKRGRTEILGRGVVESDYEFDDEQGGEYPHVHKVKWTHKGHWKLDEMLAMKTLTDITDYTETVSKITTLFETEDEEEREDEPQTVYPEYTKEDFLSEVYISESDYENLVELLHSKMNIILQGAPGVGKTFIAKRLAYSIMGVKDVERVMMVQFHQSYAYEDFIMGIRPSGSGFDIKKGAFYNFCKKADEDSEHDYFFIIDEINRGNLSKIFGELFMLLENDKRGARNKIQLLYNDEMFYIPANVYIIGMMNTADRSLAMLDYALRRRFAFFDLRPAFSSEMFKKYKAELANVQFDKLIACVEELNRQISEDESLGDGFCIGHSYFCNLDVSELTDKKLSMLVEYELIPLLKEYWFDEPVKVKEWSENLRSAIK